MTAAAQLLAVWLSPVLWLSMPALMLERGPDGLWIGLALILTPLVALGAAPAKPPSGEREPIFPVVILLFTVGILFWANMTLAGDLAAWLGSPRWHGIAVTAAGGCLLTAWPGAGRLVPALLIVVALAMNVPLADLAHAAGVGPLGAWERVANQTAFRFPPSSAWVTGGRDLGTVYGKGPIRFDEEHRITAPAGGRLYARAVDGGRTDDLEWMLAPGQSVTFRPGDRLQRNSTPRLQFESDKRVPGSPVSGIAWAAGRTPDWARCAGFLVTVLFAALALCRTGAPVATSRFTVALASGGGLVAFLWAQNWAVYSVLASPDLFLGSVTPERLLALPTAGDASLGRPMLQALLLAGGLAGFLASSVALRKRLGALDRTGGGEIGRDLGLWTGVFVIAGLASLWHLDCWSLALLALGAAASTVGPTTLGPGAAASQRAKTAAGLAGLMVFLTLAAGEQVRGGAEGLLGAVQAYPALAAVPTATLVLWICRWAASRRDIAGGPQRSGVGL